MRTLSVVTVLLLTIGVSACLLARSNPRASVAASSLPGNTTKPNFESHLKPIFQAKCQPCHFQGGKVYDQMPFDKPETIKRLGTKLFTRIKDEKERQLIREFLDAP